MYAKYAEMYFDCVENSYLGSFSLQNADKNWPQQI